MKSPRVSAIRPLTSRMAHWCMALAFAAIGLCWTSPSDAAATPDLIVVPRAISQPSRSYFTLVLRPGQAGQAGAIELRNSTARSLRVVLAPVDGQTLGTLGSAYAPPGSRAHGPTRWLRLGRRGVTLAPRGSAVVPVSVAVPRSARPGDYLSGISVEAFGQRGPKTRSRGVSIASVIRYAIGVEVSLPGPRRPLIQFTGAELQRQPAGLTFLLLARNPGNVILQGVHGWVHIMRAGHSLLSRPIEPGTFVTGTSIAYPVPAFYETPTEGTHYRISAWMRYRGGIARLETTVSFGHAQAVLQQHYSRSPTARPGTAWWKVAGVIGLILYGLLTTVLLVLRRQRRAREGAEPSMGVAEPSGNLDGERGSQPV